MTLTLTHLPAQSGQTRLQATESLADWPEALRELRRLTGQTQGELARQIGISRSAIARYETGESRPKAGGLIARTLRSECLRAGMLVAPRSETQGA